MTFPRPARALAVAALVATGITGCGDDGPSRTPSSPASSAPASAPATAAAPAGPALQGASAEWIGTRPVNVRGAGGGYTHYANGVLVKGTVGPGWGEREYDGGLRSGWFLAFRSAAAKAGVVATPSCTVPIDGHPDYCIDTGVRYGVPFGDRGGVSQSYLPAVIRLYDAGRRTDLTDAGRQFHAGAAFEVVLAGPQMPNRLAKDLKAGDVAVVWVDKKRAGGGGSLDIGTTAPMPADLLLPLSPLPRDKAIPPIQTGLKQSQAPYASAP